jgi:hypothetical protein
MIKREISVAVKPKDINKLREVHPGDINPLVH